MKKKTISKKSQTNWKRIDAMTDEDIDLEETPEISAEMFARSIVRRGLKPVSRKTQLTLRIDNDVLEFYKKLRCGLSNKNQRFIAGILRAYMEAHQS